MLQSEVSKYFANNFRKQTFWENYLYYILPFLPNFLNILGLPV